MTLRAENVTKGSRQALKIERSGKTILTETCLKEITFDNKFTMVLIRKTFLCLQFDEQCSFTTCLLQFSFTLRYCYCKSSKINKLFCSVKNWSITSIHLWSYWWLPQSYFVIYPNVMSIQKMSEIVNVPMVKITIFKLGSNEEPKG